MVFRNRLYKIFGPVLLQAPFLWMTGKGATSNIVLYLQSTGSHSYCLPWSASSRGTHFPLSCLPHSPSRTVPAAVTLVREATPGLTHPKWPFSRLVSSAVRNRSSHRRFISIRPHFCLYFSIYLDMNIRIVWLFYRELLPRRCWVGQGRGAMNGKKMSPSNAPWVPSDVAHVLTSETGLLRSHSSGCLRT